MRIALSTAVALISGCGGASELITRPVGLPELHAPHDDIFVDTQDGRLRVSLDTGATWLMPSEPVVVSPPPERSVTIRDRNTAQQTRVALDKVAEFLETHLFVS